MEKSSSFAERQCLGTQGGSQEEQLLAKAKGSRKTVPRYSPPQRSSVYRGVTRHRWTGRCEAHLWDKSCWNESQNKKVRQVYLEATVKRQRQHAYDKYWGPETILNFPKILSATQEEAATAYDMAAIEYRGLNAVTNFDLSRYINWIRPGQNGPKGSQQPLNPRDADLLPSPNNSDQLAFQTDLPDADPPRGSASSALRLLLQSSKFKEMLQSSSAEDCPSTSSPESDFPRRSFPDDIQTFFDCNEPGGFAEGDDGIFGDLNSFASPIFHCELDA